ncbi:crotonobetainyl-CoA--carnitine CoA-transferase [Escherichia coli]|nr:crotonobetainyl-CoA--carnitine CoA-transferase [Escherichia coli]
MDHLPMPKFGPLAGLRVVFSGIEIAGPFAGQMFAEWTTRSSPAAICTRCR